MECTGAELWKMKRMQHWIGWDHHTYNCGWQWNKQINVDDPLEYEGNKWLLYLQTAYIRFQLKASIINAWWIFIWRNWTCKKDDRLAIGSGCAEIFSTESAPIRIISTFTAVHIFRGPCHTASHRGYRDQPRFEKLRNSRIWHKSLLQRAISSKDRTRWPSHNVPRWVCTRGASRSPVIWYTTRKWLLLSNYQWNLDCHHKWYKQWIINCSRSHLHHSWLHCRHSPENWTGSWVMKYGLHTNFSHACDVGNSKHVASSICDVQNLFCYSTNALLHSEIVSLEETSLNDFCR